MSSHYVYCVIPAAVQSPLDLQDKIPARERIGGEGINAICHEDIAAIVSPAQPLDLPKMRAEELAQTLLAHQKVIELVMESSTLAIPFRLGTYAATEAEVVEIVAKGSRVIRRLFGEIDGKFEMDVAVTWADFASVIKEAGEEDAIKGYKESLCGDRGGVCVEERMKVGFMVKQALDRKSQETGRLIAKKLAAVSCAQRAHENMDDQMVINCAFMVEAARRVQFERTLDELDAQFADKLKFRCVGPLAPYSFYTLELKRIQWEDVDWARRLMSLDRIASPEKIEKAFRHSAMAMHPDRRGSAETGERTFDELIRARSIVLEYVQACEQAESSAQIVFSEESVRQNSLLVKVAN